jgi:hypothetical protein
MNKPLMINPQSLEAISNAEWFEWEEGLNYDICDGVAVIPIYGLLMKSAGFFSSFFGATSYERIEKAVIAFSLRIYHSDSLIYVSFREM